MSEVNVRVLGEDEWEAYRQGRLSALKESPEAFAARYADEAEAEDQFWVDRMKRSSRLVAERGKDIVGIISVRPDEELFDKAAEVFGLWVLSDLRGTGIAARLVQAAAKEATKEGRKQLLYWVGTENGRGVAFASSYGFRPTEHRRPMERKSGDFSEEPSVEEIALTLALDR